MKKTWIHTALLSLALAPLSGMAADYPIKDKTVTLIVPFAAGGPTDRVARDLAEAGYEVSAGDVLVTLNGKKTMIDIVVTGDTSRGVVGSAAASKYKYKMDFYHNHWILHQDDLVPAAFEASGYLDPRSARSLRAIFLAATPTVEAANKHWGRFLTSVSTGLQHANADMHSAYIARSLPRAVRGAGAAGGGAAPGTVPGAGGATGTGTGGGATAATAVPVANAATPLTATTGPGTAATATAPVAV
mgnify:CR=1 FL=1